MNAKYMTAATLVAMTVAVGRVHAQWRIESAYDQFAIAPNSVINAEFMTSVALGRSPDRRLDYIDFSSRQDILDWGHRAPPRFEVVALAMRSSPNTRLFALDVRMNGHTIQWRYSNTATAVSWQTGLVTQRQPLVYALTPTATLFGVTYRHNFEYVSTGLAAASYTIDSGGLTGSVTALAFSEYRGTASSNSSLLRNVHRYPSQSSVAVLDRSGATATTSVFGGRGTAERLFPFGFAPFYDTGLLAERSRTLVRFTTN